MYYFDLQCAIDFHDDIIREIGGLEGYNKTHIGYLNSALDQIQNDYYYPTLTLNNICKKMLDKCDKVQKHWLKILDYTEKYV